MTTLSRLVAIVATRAQPLGCVLCLAAVAVFSGSTPAQVPENHVVVGTIAWSGAPGTTGLWYVDLGSGNKTQVTGVSFTRTQTLWGYQGTGLPPELVKSGGFGGCFSVLRRPLDGTLFVGGGAGQNGWFHVHILKLAGSVVMSYRSVRVGQVPNAPLNTRKVGGMALLPNGRVLVAADTNLQSGPMKTSPLAILDDSKTPATLTPISLKTNSATPFGLATPFVYGVALSPDGRTAYVTNQTSVPKLAPGRLYKIDITKTQPVAPILLNTWLNSVLVKITADRNGVLYTTRFPPPGNKLVTPSIEQITVNNNKATVTSIPVAVNNKPANVAIAGPALERATGQFVFVSGFVTGMVNNNSVLMGDRKGNLSVLAGPPQGGWGMPFAIDINNTFEPYGQTKAQANHWFQEFPNPGGSPKVNNSKFSLTLQSKTPPKATGLIISLAKIDQSPFGVRLLADPAPSLGIVLRGTPSTSTGFSLPIPNQTGLSGQRLFVQGIHIDSSGAWAVTRGLDLVIQ